MGLVGYGDLAKEIGIAVEPSETNPDEWDMMQRWLLHYIDKAEDRHFVRYSVCSPL